jgi:hypothetical protein
MTASTLKTRKDWAAAAASLSIATGLFIDGRHVPALDGETFDCVNPANGSVLEKMARGQSADVDRAVASALQAWNDRRWRGLAPRARADILLRFADLVAHHADELALLETLDMGKPISDVLNIDLPEVLKTIRYFAECIDKIEGAVTHTDPSALHMIVHEPLGVVGAITPWNYPMLMASGRSRRSWPPATAWCSSRPSRRRCPARGWRSCSSMRAARPACSMWSTAWGWKPARRWRCIRTWSSCPSPAPPPWASCCWGTPASRT